MLYVELLNKRCNAGGRTFCDAINEEQLNSMIEELLPEKHDPPYLNRCKQYNAIKCSPLSIAVAW